MPDKAETYRNELRERFGNGPLVEEYINEAEHQDGEEYWDNFESFDDVVEDFNLYKENT